MAVAVVTVVATKKLFKAVKVFDVLIVVTILVFGITSAFFIFTNDESSQNVIISSPDGDFVYPINKDREIEISGTMGKTKILIKNKKVSIIDSPCKNKICILAGTIDKTSHFLVCLPNRILVKIEGTTKNSTEIDAMSY